MRSQALQRISLRWLPDAAFEDTVTIALNVGGYFIDLRVTTQGSSIQWSRAGERIILKEEPLTCRWTHIIDSLDLTVPDEAYFVKLENGDDLEIGSTPCPHKDGAVTAYEEVWRDITANMQAGDQSWILQSSDGTTFIGKVGTLYLAIKKDTDGTFTARKEELNGTWRVSFESEGHALPQVLQVLKEFEVEGREWAVGQKAVIAGIEYEVRGFSTS
ncbi:neutral amino acid transporter [Ilyonectria robusta]